MKKSFVGIVERTAKWDNTKEAYEHEGFADHAAYMGGLEAEGFIAVAGLMLQSSQVLFIYVADSEEEVRTKVANDPWQKSGLAKLIRLEEATFRIGTPPGAAPG